MTANHLTWWTTQLARTVLKDMALAFLKPDLCLADFSDNLARFAAEPRLLNTPAPNATEVFWELVGAEDDLRAMLRGEVESLVWRNLNREQAGGQTVLFSLTVVPRNPDRPAEGLLLVIEDTTHTSQLEQQVLNDRNQLRLLQDQLEMTNLELQRINWFKTTLVSMVAHDLRAPLSAIRLLTTQLAVRLPAEGRSAWQPVLNDLYAEIERLNAMIGNVLDIGQIDHGHMRLALEQCDLSLIAQNVVQRLAPLLERRQLYLNTRWADQPVIIFADPDRVGQALYNLLDNAIKYTPRGGSITLTTLLEASHGVFDIFNSGHGLPPDRVKQLFNLYQRAPADAAPDVHGLGLGLYFVKMLTEAHGGYVTVHNQPGVGVSFRTFWPVNL